MFKSRGRIMTLSYAQIEDLFHRYRDELIGRMAAMVHSRETAADLVQDTYLKLVRVAPTTTIEQPRALLYRIATNLAIDHLRADKRRSGAAEPLDAALELPCSAPSPERAAFGKERLRLFRRAVDSLPPRTKEAFVLYHVEGCSYREIATRMGISFSGVDKHIRRAIELTNAAVPPPNGDE